MRAALIGLAFLSACALNPAPVPVVGPESDLDALVGKWSGEYRSVETGRSGSILFTLEKGKDTAYGDVVMVGRDAGMTHDDAIQVATQRHAANQVLTIRFVRVTGTTVSGTIDPYPDPNSDCELITVFRGTLAGTKITGTFRTMHVGHNAMAQEGSWWVNRTR